MTLYGLHKSPNPKEEPCLVLEYVPLGSLDKLLQQNQIEVSECQWMSVHVARGMSYIHSLDILHNDLAARNVLVTKNDRENEGKYLLKIADFGLAFPKSGKVYLQTTRPSRYTTKSTFHDSLFSSMECSRNIIHKQAKVLSIQ